jgi:hypothetical protein
MMFNCYHEKVQAVQQLEEYVLISHTNVRCKFLTCAGEDVYEGRISLSPISIQEKTKLPLAGQLTAPSTR